MQEENRGHNAATEIAAVLPGVTVHPEREGRAGYFSFDSVEYYIIPRESRWMINVCDVRVAGDYFTQWANGQRVEKPSITVAQGRSWPAIATDFVRRLHNGGGKAWAREAQAWADARTDQEAIKNAAFADMEKTFRSSTWSEKFHGKGIEFRYSGAGKFTFESWQALTPEQCRRLQAMLNELD